MRRGFCILQYNHHIKISKINQLLWQVFRSRRSKSVDRHRQGARWGRKYVPALCSLLVTADSWHWPRQERKEHALPQVSTQTRRSGTSTKHLESKKRKRRRGTNHQWHCIVSNARMLILGCFSALSFLLFAWLLFTPQFIPMHRNPKIR